VTGSPPILDFAGLVALEPKLLELESIARALQPDDSTGWRRLRIRVLALAGRHAGERIRDCGRLGVRNGIRALARAVLRAGGGSMKKAGDRPGRSEIPKVFPLFWDDAAVRQLDDHEKLIALYCLTCGK